MFEARRVCIFSAARGQGSKKSAAGVVAHVINTTGRERDFGTRL
jgi:hypothetical protein